MASVQEPSEGEGIKSSHDDFEDIDLSDSTQPIEQNASSSTSSEGQDGMDIVVSPAVDIVGGQEEDHIMNGYTEEQPGNLDPSTTSDGRNGSSGVAGADGMAVQDVNGHVYGEMNGTSEYPQQAVENGVNGDSEGDEMMQDMEEETDQENGEQNPDLGKRVKVCLINATRSSDMMPEKPLLARWMSNADGDQKVYELRDQSWFDRGTGHCKGIYDDTQDLALLIVEPEETPEKAEEGQGGFLKDELLLSARVEKDDIYSRQQGKLGWI